MKTFEAIQKEMFNKEYKSPEGWPPGLTLVKMYEYAAKEYTKQWLDKLYKDLNKNQGYGSVHPEYILEQIKGQIDRQ